MARLIRSNGVEEVITPSNGKKWSLGELQKIVGGYIEMMPGIKPVRLIMNEEAKLKMLPVNNAATAIVLDLLKGKVLRYTPILRGDVIILDPKEKM